MYTIVHGYYMKRRNSSGFCYFDRSLNSLDLLEKNIPPFSKASVEHSCDRIFYRSNRETNISTTKERNCFILKNITWPKKEKTSMALGRFYYCFYVVLPLPYCLRLVHTVRLRLHTHLPDGMLQLQTY